MTLQDWTSPDDLPLLSVGISQQTQYRPAFTDALAGRTLSLVDGAGTETTCVFTGAHQVEITGAGSALSAPYDATLVRDDIYLVDIMIESSDCYDAVPGLPLEQTWALHLGTGTVTSTTSFVHERPDGSRWVRSVDEHLWLADGPRGAPHQLSSGMVGKRVLWQYSDTDRYDHVYMNARNFAWQCVAGVEEGLTELDRTRAYEVAPDLFFFGWSEHVQPVESMLFVDLEHMKTFGRMFGWEHRTGEILHHQFGARGVLLNETRYPDVIA